MPRWVIPDDWNEEQDGFISVLFCIPNSRKWRGLVTAHIESLIYGRNWDETTGTITDVQAIAREIFESLMMGCIEELVTVHQETNKLLRLTIEALTGGTVDFDTDPVVPNAADYSAIGLAPVLKALLSTTGLFGLYPDMSIADSVNAGLIGNQGFALPLPLQGDGLADIVDDQMDTANPLLDLLQQHTTMADSSIFNPVGGEKNLVEVLETTLRTTSLGDLEPFPNVVDVLQSSLKLVDDATWSKIWLYLEKKMGIEIPWAHEIPAENTVAEILAGILGALMAANGPSMSRIAQAIQGLEMQVNVNNLNGCCGADDCNCGNCAETTITANGNGNGTDATYYLGCGGDVVDG